MKNRSFILTILALAFAVMPLAGVMAEENGGYAGAYLQLSLNPRATGMGDAYTAVSDDISAIYFNPGAVAQIQKFTVGGSYRDMAYQRSLQQLAVLFPVRGEAAIAFSAEMASMGDVIGRNNRGEPTGKLDNTDAVFGITFSRRFSPFISVGGNARYYYKKLENVTANSAGFDAGAMIFMKKDAGLPENGPIDLVRFGVSVRNISTKYPWNTGVYWGPQGQLGTAKTEKVPILVRFGSSVLTLKSRLLIAADGEIDEQRGFHGYAGGEFAIVKELALRAGAANGQPTFGAGFKVPSTKFDGRIDIAIVQALNIGGWESIFGFSVGF